MKPLHLKPLPASLITLLCIGIAACTSSPKTMDMPAAATYMSIMTERYGEEGDCIMNKDESFALCTSPFDLMATTPGIRFFTYDINERQVTYESDTNCSSVSWSDAHHVEVLRSVGTVVKNAEQSKNGFVVDVRTGESSALK